MRCDRIAVDGLQFESSAVGLARQLRRCPGIISVNVDSGLGVAEVVYEESGVSPGTLRHLIIQCGYSLPRSVAAVPRGAAQALR
jgi:hypothetical protein